MGLDEIRQYLSHLTTEMHVAAWTQNVALAGEPPPKVLILPEDNAGGDAEVALLGAAVNVDNSSVAGTDPAVFAQHGNVIHLKESQ